MTLYSIVVLTEQVEVNGKRYPKGTTGTVIEISEHGCMVEIGNRVIDIVDETVLRIVWQPREAA